MSIRGTEPSSCVDCKFVLKGLHTVAAIMHVFKARNIKLLGLEEVWEREDGKGAGGGSRPGAELTGRERGGDLCI